MYVLTALLFGLAAATGGAAHAASVDSAEYDVSASVLTVTLDEPAFPIDAAHVTLTGGQGGTVVVSQGSVSHANNTATVSIDLSGQSGDFEALSHPRSITVAANGILAISGNANSGSVTLAISYDDTTPPAISSALYAISSGVLTVTLTEAVQSVSSSDITLTDGSATASVSGAAISHDSGTITISLDDSTRQAFEALSHPRSIQFAAGGPLADIWGNSNGASTSAAISYDDTAPPAVSSALYAISPGVLTVTLTEAVQSVSAGDVTLTDGSATASVSGAAISHDSGTITISLDDSTRQAFEALSHPRSMQFAAGGLADIWGNSNGASTSAAISYDDITPPAISSALYAISPGVLTITLTEAVQSVSAGDVTLTDGSATASVSGAAISHDSGTITISLDDSTRQAFEALSHPRSMQFAAGGLADIWGNSNGASTSAAISYDDITPPAISSALYAISSGVLTVTLTEAVQSVSAGDVTLTDGSATASVSGAAISHDSGTITISLDDSTRQAFEALSHPRSMQFAAGGLADIWGNSNGASTSAAILYDDITPPAISSASYDMSTAMLTVTLTEGALPIASMMLVGDQGSILVQDITHARGAESFEVALTGDTRTNFEALSGDTVRLRAGAVYDIWNNFNPEELAASITRTGEAPEPAPPEEPPDIVLGEMTAEYDLETRILSITAPAVVSSIDMGLIVLHDARDYMQVSNPVSVGNVPFFVIPLSATVEAEFLELEQPRQVTVMPGGFTYLANNATNQANVTATITYGDDTVPPDMVAAQYDTTSGDLTLRFNERVLPTSADHIRLDNITIGADDVSHAPNSLTISLSEQAVDQFIAMDPPRSVTITSGGITDVADNSNTNDITATITYLGDDSPPDVLAATYDNSTNSLAVTISEPVLAIRADAITLEYNITSAQPGSIVHDARAASFDVPLANVAAAGPPDSVTVAAGGLTDVWGNSNAAALTVAIQRDVPPPAPPPSDAPTEPPADLPVEPPVTPAAISSAVYNVTSGTLTVTLTEDMLTLLEYKVRLGAMGEVPAGSLSYVEYADSFAVSLTGAYRDGFASLPLPRPVTIISGGLVDSSGRINIDNITSAISYVGDDAPPEVVSVLYDNSTDSLVLKLSEPVFTPAADQVRLVYANATASPTPVHAAPSDSMALPLDTLPGAPLPLSVTLDAGSLMDVWGNANAAAITWNITGTAPPTTPVGPPVTPASISSAVYNTTSSTLSVTLTENILALVADKILLDDTGDGIPDASLLYANGSAAFAVTLAGSEKDRFAALTLPRSIAIAPGGLIDSAGRINVADITGAVTYVGDNAPPRISSITYDNSTRSLNVTLSEPVLTPSAGIYLVYDSGPVPVVMVMHTSHTDSLAIRLAANATLPASVQIDAGSLSDIWGNANTMRLTHNVTYAAPPTAPPPASAAISTATYNVTSAVLGVTLTENVLTVLPGNIHLDASGGGVSADSLSHTNGTASFTITLSGAERDRFESLPVPRAITISPGGLVDVHDRANAANLTGTISYTDAEFPGISSASYNATAGVILVGLTEAVTTPASGKVWLSGPAGEIAAASIVHGTDAFRITLNGTAAFEGLGTPAHVIITPGGLADLWGNANAANLTGTISYPDTQPPTIRSAVYNATSNVLDVSFSEAISSPVIDKVQVTGPGGQVGLGALSHLNDSFAVSLAGLSQDRFGSTQPPTRVTIQPGGVSDIHNNANDGTLTRTIDVAGAGGAGIAAAQATEQAAAQSPTTFEGLGGADAIEIVTISGKTYALIAGESDDAVQIIDVTSPASPSPVAAVFNGTGGFSELDGPTFVTAATISGDTYALIASKDDDGVQIINITSPASPAPAAALTDGSVYDALQDPRSVKTVAISGDTYALVPSRNDDALSIINVTDPSNPALTAVARHNVGNFILEGLISVDTATISGKTYALTTSESKSAVQITDISTPSSPTAVANVRFSHNIYGPLLGVTHLETVAISGKTYALAGGTILHGVQIIDISTPSSPANTAAIFDENGGFTAMRSPQYVDTVAISGKTYALVAGSGDNGVQIIDISTPSSPTVTAAIFDGQDGFTALKGAAFITTTTSSGKTYALVAGKGDNAVQIIDITDPAKPKVGAAIFDGAAPDATPPTLSSAIYNVSSGVLTLTLSEALSAHDSTKVVVYNSTKTGNLTLPANAFADGGAGILAATLTSGQKSSIEALDSVRSVDVLPGGVTDVWGNPNSATLTSTISGVDAPPIAIRSAVYNNTSGALSVSMSAAVQAPAADNIRLNGTSSEMSVSATPSHSADTFTIQLSPAEMSSFGSLGHPRSVTILANGTTDGWNVQNAANLTRAISYTDTTPPAMQSAVYNATSKVLNVTFSEPVLTPVAMYAASYADLVPLTSPTHSAPTASLAVTLAGDSLERFEALRLPRSVEVYVNDVSDNWGNNNTRDLRLAITYAGVSDTAPPALQSAAYNITTSVLNLVASERLGDYNSTKIILYDSTLSGNVTFPPNHFKQSKDGHLDAVLNSTQRAAFVALNHPRSVAILSGGIADVWGNANAASLSVAVSYPHDTTLPGLSSATYDVITGVLNITISERLSAHDSTKIILYDSAMSANLTLPANSFTQSTYGYLNATLNAAQRTALENLGHPRTVAISPGGITDMWGNSNTARLSVQMSYSGDAVPPTLQSAAYDTTAGVLNLTASERLSAHDSTKIILYGSLSGNLTLPASSFTQPEHGSLSATLNAAQRAAFENLGHPRNATILPGGITDMWGNANDANLTRAISYTDTTSPAMQSAVYDATSKTLNVTFSEPVITPVAIDVTSHNASLQLRSAAYAAPTASVAIALNGTDLSDFENLRPPRSALVFGLNLVDNWGNRNTEDLRRTITYAGTGDTAPPALQSASYDVNAGVLNLTMSERLGYYDSTKIVLYDSALSGNVTFPANAFAQSTHGYLSVTLNATQRAAFVDLDHPRNVAVSPGGATDMWGNSNAARLNSTISYTDATPPAMRSASYDTTAGVLNLTMSERLGDYDSTKITLYDSTLSGNVTFPANHFTQSQPGYLSATLSSAQKTAFLGLTSPRNVAVSPGGVTDLWGNSNAAHLNSTISYTGDTASPAMRSAIYNVTSDTLHVKFDEDVHTYNSSKIVLGSGADSMKTSSLSLNNDTFTMQLNSTERSKFIALSLPRNVIILPGGVADIYGNSNDANETLAISYTSVKPLSILSATYDTSASNPHKLVNVSLSLPISHINTSKALVAGTALKSITYANDTFTFDADGLFGASGWPNLPHPISMVILPGGATDIWGNSNAANLTIALSYLNDNAPSLDRVIYQVSRTELAFRFHNNDQVNVVPEKVRISARVNNTDTTIPLSNYTDIPGQIVATLNTTETAHFLAHSLPRTAYVESGGFTTAWGTPIANQTRTIKYVDDSPIQIWRAHYGVDTHRLTVHLERDGATFPILKRDMAANPYFTIAHSPLSQTYVRYDEFKYGYSANPFELRHTDWPNQWGAVSNPDFIAMIPPRMLTIMPGGILSSTGVIFPNIQNISATIVYSDTTPPTLSSATYNLTSGGIALVMDERVLVPNSTLYRINSTNGEMAVSNIAHTTHTVNSTVILNATERGLFAALSLPRHITIMPNGTTDIWDNSNTANLSRAISYTNPLPPSIESAVYNITSGVLAVTMNQHLLAADHAKMRLNDTSAEMSIGGLSHAAGADVFTSSLSESEKAQFESLTPPRHITILPGGIADVANNKNANNLTRVITYVTASGAPPPPTINSAVYNVTSGTLNVTLSERALNVAVGKIRLNDTSSEMPVSTISHTSHHTSFTITLDSAERSAFLGLTPPRHVTILPGGVTGIWDTSNTSNLTQAVTYITPPTNIDSAVYNVTSGILNVTLSERPISVVGGEIILNSTNSEMPVGAISRAPSGASFTTSLNSTERSTFAGMTLPRHVTILPNGIVDAWNIANAHNITGTITYVGNLPTYSIRSALYNTTSGLLTVNMSGILSAANSTGMRLNDTSGEIAASNITHTAYTSAFEIRLSGSAKGQFESMTVPRHITITPGGITGIWDNANTANLTGIISYTDTAPPAILRGIFYPANDTLSIKLNERILPTMSGNILLNDTSATLQTSGSPSHPSNDSILLKLNSTERNILDTMVYPRTVTIQTMSDIWGNTAVNSTATLTYNVTLPPGASVPPAISSAAYDTASGILNVTMNQPVLTPVTGMVRLLDASAEMPISALSHITGGGYFTVTLNTTERAAFEDLSHPRNMTILPGGVSDTQGAQNTANLTAAISYSDVVPPAISYATFYPANDTLAIKLDERILPTISGNIMINDSSATLRTAGAPSHPSNDSILLKLSGAERNILDTMLYPRTVTIQTMSDIWGNTAANSTATLTYNVTLTPGSSTPPAISSAAYDTASGILNVTMNQPVLTPVTSTVRLLDASAEMPISALSHITGGGYFTVTLNTTERAAFEDLSHPRNVTILPGGISGIQNNYNAANLTAAISYSDDAPPAISYATFYPANDTLAVKLDERILPTSSGNIMLNDTSVTITPSGSPSHPSNDSILMKLNSTERAAFDKMAYPRTVTVQIMSDIWGNTAENSTATLTYNVTLPPGASAPPAISSAAYDTASGILNVTMNQPVLSPVTGMVRLLDASGEMPISALSHMTGGGYFTVTLNTTERAAFEDLSHPRNVTILPGGISGIQNNYNAANLTAAISYSDDAPPAISYATLTPASDTLSIKLNERILPTISGNIMINDSSATLQDCRARPSHPSSDSILLKLNSTERNILDTMLYPRTVTIQAMTDIWDNTAENSTTTLTYNVTLTPGSSTPPAISSAAYDTASGILNVTMNQLVLTPVTSTVRLLDGSAEMPISALSHATGGGYFTVTLNATERAAFEDLSHPRNMTILPGGISGLQNNYNAANLTAAISYSDDAPPAISYATFYPANDTLAVKLDERILPTISGNIMINDSSATLRTAGAPSHPSSDSILLKLNSKERNILDTMLYPRTVTIQAMTDIWDNTAENSTATLTYNVTLTPGSSTPPAISSAVYNTTSGVLTTTINQNILTPVTSTVRLLDGSAEMSVSVLSHATGKRLLHHNPECIRKGPRSRICCTPAI